MDQQSEVLLPPKDLIYRVAGTSDPEWFVQSGRQSVKDIEAALRSVGRNLAEYTHVLDFGCGCGRIMLQLKEVIPLTLLTGVDIDSEAIAWLRPNVPGATLRVVNELPPMPLPEASFDLVYCHSVFTHLDSNYQDQWLAELSRVCKPGATLIVSFSGLKALQELEQQWIKANADPAPMRRELEDAGILFITDDGWKNGPFPEFYHSSFHTAQYVREHWGKYFKILNHIPSGSLGYQDFVVMERVAPMEPETQMAKNRSRSVIAMPPPEFRVLVGPLDDEYYDNPTGDLVFPEVPAHLYGAVFDFGSGCGRQARQLMQQNIRPQRYVGVDINRGMVAWCQTHLSTVDSNFLFLHHNVYNPGLAPDNSPQLTAPFPVGSGEFTLVNAHSVFTHIYQHQTEYYLREMERILTPDGIARTTWFLFDRRGYPWLEQWQNCLFVNSDDPTNAVIYDWKWFLGAVASAGLAVKQTALPSVPGHQWQVFLEKRRDGSRDQFPSPEVAAEWLCGANESQRSRYLREIETIRSNNLDLCNEIADLRNSWSWRWTRPLRKLAILVNPRNSPQFPPD